MDDGVNLHISSITAIGHSAYCTWYNQAMKRDLSKATPIKKLGVIIGYIYPVNEEYWLPLDMNGEQLGPPTYRTDAEAVITRQ